MLAQSNGSIVGTVKDSKGGTIAGATVRVSQPTLGLNQSVQSSAEGEFVFPLLPPGTYTLTAEMAGFKKGEKSNVVLPAGSKISVGDVVLEIGSLSETVTVEAEAGTLQIQTESGERSNLVTNRQLRDIGLNGRNVVDLMRTIPGVIAGGVTANAASTVTNITGGFSINGTRSLQHEYTLDGVTNLNLGNNTGALVSVNPDALQEVKVLTSNYQAEYGRAGGGFIALTTRGGTNSLHGGARYFRRHDSLNADTFFNNARGGSASGFPRPLYRYNFYGWDLGGPVVIPKVVNGRNKLFFFISQEYYRQLVPQAASVNIRVPTAAERNGDFTASVDGSGKAIIITDPNTGLPFPGNSIPSNRIYAPGKAVLNFLPTPNTTAGANAYNYTSQVPSSYPRSENILRGDWQITSTARMSVRWVYNHDDQQFAYGTTTASWNWPLTITDRKNGPGSVPTISLANNFTPTLINEFMFGVGRGGVTIAPSDDKATRTSSGINTPLLYPSANESNLIPSLSFGGIASVAAVANTSVFGTFDQRFSIPQMTDNLTKVKGKHIIKMGVYYQSASNASNSQTNVESNIDFQNNASNPLNTGNPFSNTLLGVYFTYTQANAKPHGNYLYHDVSWYVQDTWKIHPRVTLDLGVRFSWYQPVYNAAGDGSFFDPSLFDPAKAPRIYRPVCVGAATCASGATTYRAIDPSVSGAPSLTNTLPSFYVGKLVPGSGDFSDGLKLASQGYPKGGIDAPRILYQPRLGLAWDVTGSHKTVVRGGFGTTYDRYQSGITGFGATNPPFVLNPTLSNGYLQDITSGGTGALSPLALTGVVRDSKFPTIYSYSIGVQRNLGVGTVLDVSYVGSRSTHLARRTNLNSPAYGATFKAAAQDPTKYANGVIPVAEAGLPSIYSGAGLSFSGTNALPVDYLRPYQGYSDITYYQFDGDTTFHSMQVEVKRRFTRGITFSGAYTLSRALTTVSDDSTFTNIQDAAHFDYGLANFDRTHYFAGTFVWDLPKGSRLLGGGRAVRVVFDDWTLSGFTSLASGSPTELTLAISGQDAGNRLLGTYTAGNLSGQQPRFLVTGQAQSGGTINTAAFGVPGVGNIGPYPRFYLRNPGIHNQDLSVFKNLPFGGEGKRYLQLRVEAFNVFNHTQYSGRNLTTNVTNGAGQTGNAIFSNYTGLTVTNNLRPSGSASVLGTYFGELNAARDMRIIQLAAKFYF
jgi:hypothetical protein